MKVVCNPVQVQKLCLEYRNRGLRIGLVPTMGWFHEGHLSLMRKAKQESDRVVVSLFVNPIQFGPSEDLDSYPQDLDRDSKLAEEVGVDVLFAPDKDAIYGTNFASTVSVAGLSSGLCGASRPLHFDGVTTVVSKLFNLTVPHIAIFGEKDFQQLAIIRKLVTDLNFPIEIIGHPIVREANGLAMSSRNSYLKEEEMAAALSLSQGIAAAKQCVHQEGIAGVSVQEIRSLVHKRISGHPECEVDYIEIVNRFTLAAEPVLSLDSQLVVAVKINNRIRLIDNSILKGS